MATGCVNLFIKKVTIFRRSPLSSHHLSDNAVAHLDRSNENEHIKEQFAYIIPYLRDRCRIGVYYGRRRSKHREYNAGQYDNRTFKQYGAAAFDEGLAHILTRFTGEGGQRDRRK